MFFFVYKLFFIIIVSWLGNMIVGFLYVCIYREKRGKERELEEKKKGFDLVLVNNGNGDFLIL